MSTPPEPLFLERRSYRRRRLMDAARLLPFAGAGIFLLPVLWTGQWTMISGIAFIFGSWIVLIGCAGLLSRRLAPPLKGDAGDEGEP
jgi:hypothetical protein